MGSDLVERLLHGDKRKCPFPDIDIEPTDPCPICGDLGTIDADLDRTSMCVDGSNRMLHKEAAARIAELEAALSAEKAKVAELQTDRDDWRTACNENADAWDHERTQRKAAEAEADRLKEVLGPFSYIAGEIFARNYNKSDAVFTINGLTTDGYPVEMKLTAGAFFAARAALGASQ